MPRTRARRDGLNDRCRGRWAGRNGVNAETQRAQSCHSTPLYFVEFVHGVEATVLRNFLPSNSPCLCVLCASAFQSFPTRVCQKVPPLHSPRTIFSSKWTDKEMGLTQRRRGRRVVTRHRCFLSNLFTGLRRQFSEDLSRRIHPVSASSAPLRFNLSLLVSARKYGPFIRAARSFRASEPTKKWG